MRAVGSGRSKSNLLSWVLVASLKVFEESYHLPPYFCAEEGPQGQIGSDRAEVGSSSALEARTEVIELGVCFTEAVIL
jgi:hypothetical protein